MGSGRGVTTFLHSSSCSVVFQICDQNTEHTHILAMAEQCLHTSSEQIAEHSIDWKGTQPKMTQTKQRDIPCYMPYVIMLRNKTETKGVQVN